TLAFPASTMSTTGILDAEIMWIANNSANAKLTNMAFGGTNIRNANITSLAYARDYYRIRNRNSASVQGFEAHTSAGANTTNGYAAINTGASVNITFAPSHSVAATDIIGIEGIQFLVTN